MPPNQDPEDFIPLTDSNLATFETTSAHSSSPEPSSPEADAEPSPFSPSTITSETIQTLLTAYPTTIEKVYRQKLLYKAVPQPTKGKKKRAQRKAASSDPVFRPPTDEDLDKGMRRYVEGEMEKFRALDQWRYEDFPKALGERKRKGNELGWGKEEIVRVMEWKTKHGLPRPTLMGMIKTNKEKAVRSATSSALASLPSQSPSSPPDANASDAFPKTSLDKLAQPLRGVGPATASLILSIATCPPSTSASTSTERAETETDEIPFYSDDTFLWLCLGVYPGARKSLKRTARLAKQTKPNGELNVKYNLHEYRELWGAVRGLRRRLKGEVSAVEVEKAAFVIRHFGDSGLEGVFHVPPAEEDRGVENREEEAKERAKMKAKARAKELKESKKRKKKEMEMEQKEKRKRDEGETPAEKKERKKRKYNNR